MPTTETHRILIADDTATLHESYRNIFTVETDALAALASMAKFAPALAIPATPAGPRYELTHVMQGEEAITAVTSACLAGAPFALVILDVRMPPGIDGVQTARRLREAHPDLQIVLCTAFADYTWNDLVQTFPNSDGVLLLKKPFDTIEIRQLASALCRKWQLARSNAELIRNLETRVANRTTQLAKTADDLTLALTAAQIAERAKHDFLRCVSHELNSPLNGVHGAASVLTLCDNLEARQMGQIIIESSTRLNRLFNRILLYLQLDPAPPRSPQPLSPATLLARAVEPHRAVAQAKGLTLDTRFTAPPLLTVLGRPEWLETALDSLVENACKFTTVGSICVHIQYDQSHKVLVIAVVDTGEGIATAKHDELFTLFTPGDRSMTRKQSGIGIGLALVARIAQTLQGKIEVRAGNPNGSVFTLTIPCTTVPA